ncbi:cytochrome c3 family protein [Geomonas nitrogeniifigens]|uniref:cytochrome c3 family protein n=1 Tax=Geomonas diazotrophica TaxID=2843197 RepID=UPI001C2C67AC|nr:cytochrome c3 family protein [Geomonas nitrogeniifigens]QXE85638.1 cytochrome c3 family protein [Geomonas nitrogeniifigens]
MARALGTKFVMITCVIGVLHGCDPITVHKISTTILDGAPSMPPADQYCQELTKKDAPGEHSAVQSTAGGIKKDMVSSHPPYKEARCYDCHDGSTDKGLIEPPDRLCFVCHPDIKKKYFVHGPVATGACLQCHDPHSSREQALLKVEKKKLCFVCHKEKRIAEAMHQKVVDNGMACTDCHDPHDGDVKYFLR